MIAFVGIGLPGTTKGAETVSGSGCDLVAAPNGSDSGSGTAESPFRSSQRLAEALAPGEVGCLRAGTYGGGLTVKHGGTDGQPVTLRSYPGERAEITGRVYVPRGSDYVTIADLSLDGNYQGTESPLPSPTVNAAHVTFTEDDVTNEHTAICFVLGSPEWGEADYTVIEKSRIHDCGVLPAINREHGIYMEDAVNARIVDDVIIHNADRGIQLYPDSTGARIEDDVIAENGENIIFSGAEGVASSDNVVEHDLIVNANIRYDVESWYPEGNPVGVGNMVSHNCVSEEGISTSGGGFVAEANVAASESELTTSEGTPVAVAGSACASQLPSSIVTTGSGEVKEEAPSEEETPAGSPTQTEQPEGSTSSKEVVAGETEASSSETSETITVAEGKEESITETNEVSSGGGKGHHGGGWGSGGKKGFASISRDVRGHRSLRRGHRSLREGHRGLREEKKWSRRNHLWHYRRARWLPKHGRGRRWALLRRYDLRRRMRAKRSTTRR